MPGYDHPFYDSWWGGDWYVEAANNLSVTVQPHPISTTLPVTITGDIDDKTKIEALGTRYYSIEPDASITQPYTLDILFRPDHEFGYSNYEVSVLDLTLDSTGVVSEVNAISSMVDRESSLFSIPEFPRDSDHRAVIVVSAADESVELHDGFVIEATLAPTRTLPIALPDPFSPNEDGRKDETYLAFELPPLSQADHTYMVELAVQTSDGQFHSLHEFAQPLEPQQTHGYTWTGELNGTTLADGTYTTVLTATELDSNVVPTTLIRTYTNTVHIDVTAPISVTDLQLLPGVPAKDGMPSEPDTLEWIPPTNDTSYDGFDQLIFVSSVPITNTNIITPYTRVTSTTTSLQIPFVNRSRYYAVVVEDAAGNRSKPAFVQTDRGKANIVIIGEEYAPEL